MQISCHYLSKACLCVDLDYLPPGQNPWALPILMTRFNSPLHGKENSNKAQSTIESWIPLELF